MYLVLIMHIFSSVFNKFMYLVIVLLMYLISLFGILLGYVLIRGSTFLLLLLWLLLLLQLVLLVINYWIFN